MGKKSSAKVSLLYLIGTALTTIGFCIPVFRDKHLTSISFNGFNFINFDNGATMTAIGALLLFIGAAAGLLVAVLALLKVKVPSAKTLMLILLIVSIVGGVLVVIASQNNAFSKFFGKQFLKGAFVGFYFIIVGWVVALIGAITGK